MGRTTAITLPETSDLLIALGDRLRAARLRRGLSSALVASRAGMSLMTLRAIERGRPSVTIGAYLSVLQTLGLEKSLAQVAANDLLGRSLQDAARQRAPRSRKVIEVRLPLIAAKKPRGGAVSDKFRTKSLAKSRRGDARKSASQTSGDYAVRNRPLRAKTPSRKATESDGIRSIVRTGKGREKGMFANREAPSQEVAPSFKRGVHSDDLLKVLRGTRKG